MRAVRVRVPPRGISSPLPPRLATFAAITVCAGARVDMCMHDHMHDSLT